MFRGNGPCTAAGWSEVWWHAVETFGVAGLPLYGARDERWRVPWWHHQFDWSSWRKWRDAERWVSGFKFPAFFSSIPAPASNKWRLSWPRVIFRHFQTSYPLLRYLLLVSHLDGPTNQGPSREQGLLETDNSYDDAGSVAALLSMAQYFKDNPTKRIWAAASQLIGLF